MDGANSGCYRLCVRHCPVCQASYEDSARFCPDDGSPLRESPDIYVGKVFQGQFEIRGVCGRGSMGTVYKAWQKDMDRLVAVKVLRRDLLRDQRIVKRFRREAKASAQLSHPSIITVYVVGDTDDGVPFIAMEFVKGRSLDEVLAQEVRLSPLRSIHIVRQICSALAEAHAHHIVHRDLKPENIFLCPTLHTPEFVKILDFGIAKILYANEESLQTQTGAIFGTPYYLSPEQASGAEIDHRCDLYALGVVLFRMLTGRLPFDKESGVAVLVQHLREVPPRPRDLVPDLPRELEAVVLKALEKAPARRWQSAQEMSAALESIQSALQAGGSVSDADPRSGHRPVLPATICDPSLAPVAVRQALPSTVTQAPAAAASAVAPDSTGRLAWSVTSRRRVLAHILIGLGSMAGGSALGGLLYWRRTVAAPPPGERLATPAPVPDAAPPSGVAAPTLPAAVGRPADATLANRTEPLRAHTPPDRRRSPGLRQRQTPASRRASSQPGQPASAPATQPTSSRNRARRTKVKEQLGPPPVGPEPSTEGDHGETPPPASTKTKDPYDLVE